MYDFAVVPVICREGLDKGTGSESFTRYYYDSTKKTCKEFEYTGHGGNNNNFVSMGTCMSVCSKSKCENVFVLHFRKN